MTGDLNDYKEYKCFSDSTLLETIDVKKTIIDEKVIRFRVLKCPTCNCKYTVLSQFKQGAELTIDNEKYRNIDPRDQVYSAKRTTDSNTYKRKKCYVYDYKCPNSCQVCRKGLQSKKVFLLEPKGKGNDYSIMYCSTCDTYYTSYLLYKAHSRSFRCINGQGLNEIKRQMEWKNNPPNQKKKAIEIHKESLKKSDSIKRSTNNKKTNQIEMKDFLVKGNTFKCNHAHHSIKNINAIVSVIDTGGDLIQTTIQAGYCPNCKVYFILDSTYQRLKKMGIIACRVSDEKAYRAGGKLKVNDMDLAQESKLKQYGYSVSQNENRTVRERRRILELLVDNQIMSKSEIISYLDFFIRQHKRQANYQVAVSRWESDKEYISEYRKNEFKTYGVNSFRRR